MPGGPRGGYGSCKWALFLGLLPAASGIVLGLVSLARGRPSKLMAAGGLVAGTAGAFFNLLLVVFVFAFHPTGLLAGDSGPEPTYAYGGTATTRPAARALTDLRPGEKRLPAGFLAAEGSKVHPSGWPTEIVCTRDGAAMVFVPAGEFVSGLSPEQRDALAKMIDQARTPAANDPPDPLRQIREDLDRYIRPMETVRLGAFYIDKYEVTNRQYRLFMAGQKDDAHKPGIQHHRRTDNIPRGPGESWYDLWSDKRHNHDDQPVTCVSPEDATAYARWAGRGLPSRLQWERAAVGEGGRIFFWGSEPIKGACRCNAKPVGELELRGEGLRGLFSGYHEAPATVGSFPVDRSPFGCYDMAGNVNEWVVTDRKLPTGEVRTEHVLMGGCTASVCLENLAPAREGTLLEGGRQSGFRTVLVPEGPAVGPAP